MARYKKRTVWKSKISNPLRKSARFKKRGVPIGYPEAWTYRGRWRERKVAPGRWRFNFRATKRRRGRSLGGFGVGTTGKWRINATQHIRKSGIGKYETYMTGTKKSLGFRVKKPRRR